MVVFRHVLLWGRLREEKKYFVALLDLDVVLIVNCGVSIGFWGLLGSDYDVSICF